MCSPKLKDTVVRPHDDDHLTYNAANKCWENANKVDSAPQLANYFERAVAVSG